ncbi:MAG: radical SAM protein [bacterium]
MRILVVAPEGLIFPIGIGYIIAVWKRAGHHVDAINLSFSSGWEIRKGDYDFVATGGLACHLTALRAILCKAQAAGVPTILGGGIVTSEPELMATALRPNYCVLGEGEDTAVELLAALEAGRDPEQVSGVGFFRDGVFITSPHRKPILDLDRLPTPDMDALGFPQLLDQMRPSDMYSLDLFDHPRSYPLLGSRSCPYSCTFCYHPLGQKYRQRSLDSIMAELADAIPRYRINVVEILDELFAVNSDRLIEWCRRLRELTQTVPWQVRWSCQLRVDRLSDALLATLKESGCFCVSFGFESYSDTVLRSMEKHITPEQIHKAVHMTLSRRISLQGNFIFGDKAETRETAEETLSFWREHSESGIMLGFIHPYPNSPIYQYCQEKGIIKDRLDFIEHHLSDRINMTELSNFGFFLLVARVAMHSLRYTPHAPPSRLEADRIVVACPHCGSENDYRNFRVFDGASGGIRAMVGRLLLNRVLHCRICRHRFCGRSWLVQWLVIMARPLFWPGVHKAVFGLIYAAQIALPAVRTRMTSGTVQKVHS